MKLHTSAFKEEIKEFGRQFDTIVSYINGSETIELGGDDLNSITINYEGAILKSVMREVDIDSNIEIPQDTIINIQYGVLVDEQEDEQTGEITNVYNYINFGDFIVKEIEKQEGTDSYKLKCYDKMIYAMVDYETPKQFTEDATFEENKKYFEYTDGKYILYNGERTASPVSLDLYEEITYPITIDNYINAICNHLGLTFKNYNEEYANYDKTINNELFISPDGTSIDYTFRDVFDDLAEVTASTIVINEDDNELEIRYINDTEDTIDGDYLSDTKVDFNEKFGPVNSIVLSRAADADNVYLKDDESIEENGLCEIKISDNEIMNFNDRDTFLPDILEQLDGLEFYLNDYNSTGICYYNICDKYNVEVTRYNEETEQETTTTYPCIMFNDEVLITQGLEENIFTKAPDGTQTDYKNAAKTDQMINKAYIIAKKNDSEIESLTSVMTETEETIEQVIQNVTGLTNNFIKNGGTNLFYNTGLHFKDEEGNFTYWEVEPENQYNATTDTTYQANKQYYSLINNNYILLIAGTDYQVGDTILGTIYEITLTGFLNVVNDAESLSGTNMVLPFGKVKQTITVTPGIYSFSFFYKQNLPTATCSATINNKTIQFENNTDWQEIDSEEQQIEVTENSLTIEFNCDVQGGYYIKELMLNRGTESVEYTQNINETRTDTVQISNGILVSSSSTNTESRHDADGFRILRKDNQEVVLRATENGTETTSIKASEDSEIAGLIIKKNNGHVLLSGKGDD